ncbi:MAG: threonylcarbamoyl-AMP synthase [Candidatus Diapherotrites archaeon CG10_big_fil_rev_8_21_14_0_10_31_34]|nr:MAG: threonylcarbamoyl-AMP synthase [Candidatus Diapherotrites archaeon CG10_big_fil_rev_8_21_14_0_10_31_34]PJA21115.1 MAG: threonylcarbamoyl-AMP synthase [Candidatus Diapherotrites archaeon CG_4_10_14_0_2_um_filter_31_5]
MNVGIKTAVFVLKKNGVIVYPTETSYGIGCKISDIKSIKRIREIKQDRKKPFVILVSSKEMAQKFAEINPEAEKLLEEFKGNLTLIVPKKTRGTELIPKEVSEKTIALRISSNEIANSIVETIGEPIISTSANLSGKKPIYSFKEAVKILGKKVDFIFDAKTLAENEPSTIYDVQEKKIVRKGKTTLKEIETFRKSFIKKMAKK